jgi:hypothetical protein
MAADENELRLLAGNIEAAQDELDAVARTQQMDAATRAAIDEVTAHLGVIARVVLTLLEDRQREDGPDAQVVPLWPDGDDSG